MRLTLWAPRVLLLVCSAFFALSAGAATRDEFAESIRPVLAQNCAACHNPANPRNRINFLKANTAQDIESNRGLWRNVAAQLRNRTMPPVETKLTEEERLRVAAWIDNRLRQTACAVGDFAGAVALRRLNRREYHNTIRDLLGVDYNVSELFPNDGTGGSGFDTNGETLFIPPLLMERYLEAAQQILDRAIVTPDLQKTFTAAELLPAQSRASATAPRDLAPGKELTAMVSIYVDGDYRRAGRRRTQGRHGHARPQGGWRSRCPSHGATRRSRRFRRRPSGSGRRTRRRAASGLQRAGSSGARSAHALAGLRDGRPFPSSASLCSRGLPGPRPRKLALHYRLLGVEPGGEPLRPAKRPNRSCAPSCARPTGARWKPPT